MPVISQVAAGLPDTVCDAAATQQAPVAGGHLRTQTRAGRFSQLRLTCFSGGRFPDSDEPAVTEAGGP